MSESLLFPEKEWEYVNVAIERVKLAWGFHHMMNPDGKPMHLAFSGGKDSVCLFFICKRASEELGIPMEKMFHVQYNVTNVDPPELVRFIRDVMKKQYPFIELHHPEKTMWKLIVEKGMPPTRMIRYCCSELKEVSHIKGGYCLTGVRRAESAKRSNREGVEIFGKTIKQAIYLGDNFEGDRETRYCMQTESYMCNPIIDWSDEDVWHYIHGFNLPYCELYDKGEKRLGCLGCPMSPERERIADFEQYPKFAECYKRAFQKMIDNKEVQAKRRVTWKDGEECFDWWVHSAKAKLSDVEQNETLF